jgi:hypothetical protein
MKWTEQEEIYALRIINDFEERLLPLEAGTALTCLLMSLLKCDKMRLRGKAKFFRGMLNKRVRPCPLDINNIYDIP